MTDLPLSPFFDSYLADDERFDTVNEKIKLRSVGEIQIKVLTVLISNVFQQFHNASLYAQAKQPINHRNGKDGKQRGAKGKRYGIVRVPTKAIRKGGGKSCRRHCEGDEKAKHHLRAQAPVPALMVPTTIPSSFSAKSPTPETATVSAVRLLYTASV